MVKPKARKRINALVLSYISWAFLLLCKKLWEVAQLTIASRTSPASLLPTLVCEDLDYSASTVQDCRSSLMPPDISEQLELIKANDYAD